MTGTSLSSPAAHALWPGAGAAPAQRHLASDRLHDEPVAVSKLQLACTNALSPPGRQSTDLRCWPQGSWVVLHCVMTGQLGPQEGADVE
mmetsp:Transcript_27673/g.63965  ORF Transcript_27673/g.63965 Transcript_27673/m.63965 type:complete len:89 (-) Transcript_27673:549-815(-)